MAEKRLRVTRDPVTQMVVIAESDRPAHWVEVESWELVGLIADLSSFVEKEKPGATTPDHQ